MTSWLEMAALAQRAAGLLTAAWHTAWQEAPPSVERAWLEPLLEKTVKMADEFAATPEASFLCPDIATAWRQRAGTCSQTSTGRARCGVTSSRAQRSRRCSSWPTRPACSSMHSAVNWVVNNQMCFRSGLGGPIARCAHLR